MSARDKDHEAQVVQLINTVGPYLNDHDPDVLLDVLGMLIGDVLRCYDLKDRPTLMARIGAAAVAYAMTEDMEGAKTAKAKH